VRPSLAEQGPVPPRFPVAGILVSCVTYASAVASILAAARARRSFVAAATSVHPLTLGATDARFGRLLNSFDLLTPDGQPVRWGLNLLHGVGLSERVYGPTLMLRLCEAAAREGIGIYLYGGRPHVLRRLVARLGQRVPGLRIAGFRSPPFRPLTPDEDAQDVQAILDSGAGIVFVGLGCPKQEEWAAAHRGRLPLAVVCVGAAFDFHAGTLRQAPPWMQARGLEWLFRLAMEPRRLWLRYAKYNPLYVYLLARDYLQQRVRPAGPSPVAVLHR
jgi:N-acetylglucosaminyldiphosphoundecaprenol N-acetyl-beta-D-mannosaminyltransferase